MTFLLLKQKIHKLIQQPVTKKGLISFGVVTSLFFTFQNCSETKFAEMQLASQSTLSIEDACSLDEMRESSISMGISGYNSLPLNPTQMRSVPQGSFAYIWINGFQKIEDADWYISKDGGAETPMGNGEKFTYPKAPSSASGLTVGNYKVRINMSKICDNLAQNSNVGVLSKAQQDASSRIEKNIYIQFNVIDPATVGCQSLAGVFLNADDPKTVNTDVRYSIALPANCSLPVTYNFGDGSPNLENASLIEKHKFAHPGQYTSQARLGSESTAFKKDLSKNVVILSECPKPQNMFISGPSTLKIGSAGEYELQNYNNNNCNLGITKVTFKKDSSKIVDDVEAPFKTATSWQASEARIEPDFNAIVAEVYFNSPEDYGVTNPFIVKKAVNLTESVSGCSAEALSSISISGPTSALAGATLTHLAVIPDCIRSAVFVSANSVEWSLEGVSPTAEALQVLGGGLFVSRAYTKTGQFELKAKIKDTKVGEINLRTFINILDPNPPVCSSFIYNDWGQCTAAGQRSRTVKKAQPLGCTGGDPLLTEPCNNYVPPSCSSHTYTEYGACQADGKKYRELVSSIPAGCTSGVPPVLSESCVYTPPVCASFTYNPWGACQPDSKQYRTINTSVPAGCAGGNPVLDQPCVYTPPPPPTCTGFTYNPWGACQPNNTQTRTVNTSTPSGCVGGNPTLQQSCVYTAPVCNSWTYSQWGACQPNNTQTRTVSTSLPAGCAGGTPVTSQACVYTPPVCTDFTYSSWNSCQPNNTQTRSVLTSLPAGCAGGSPVTSQMCVYVPPPVACTGYTYSEWGSCQPENKRFRTVLATVPAGCTGSPGTPVTEDSCTYVPPVVACTSFNYSAWGACQSNNMQTRTVTSSSPNGCTGGNPVTSQSCVYTPPTCNYSYTSWGACQPNSTQTRSVTSSSPAGCAGTPVTSQSCVYVPPACTDFNYTSWGACQPNNTQSRSVISSGPSGCSGGSPVTIQACVYVPPVCNYSYSSWGACQINSTQSRTVLSSSPAGCAGTPVTTQDCVYVPPTCNFNYSGWGACQPNSTQTRSVTSTYPAGCAGGTPVTSQSCVYTPPTCSSFTYSQWGACQANNVQYRSVATSAPNGCVNGSPELSQACCFNGATNPGACSVCPSGQTLSHITGRCEVNAANRWCHKASASGPTIGYQDSGAVHEPGCFHQTLNQWYAVGAVVNIDGHAIRCDSGPASQFPVPDSNCPVSQCTPLSSSAVCSVTKKCANGKVLPAATGMVPNVANIYGTYGQEVAVGQPAVDETKWSITGWNLNGNTLKMTCDNINNQLQWRQSADGYCTATYNMSQAETDADPNCEIPVTCPYGQVAVNNRCVDECGDVVGTLKVRQAVTSGTGSKRSMMISQDVHMQSHCSDNGFDYIPWSERTVERIMQASRYNMCMYPGLPHWYEGGRWVGWNGYVVYGGTLIDGDYKIVRNPRAGFAPGHQTVGSFASQRGLTLLLGSSGIGSGDYVCLRPPPSGNSGGSPGGSPGGGYQQNQVEQ